jgi:hypothetical protein
MSGMHRFARDEEAVDLEELRVRLRRMSEAELVRYGQDAAFMCSPRANMGKPPCKPFVIQLEECRAEWRRRHPRPSGY